MDTFWLNDPTILLNKNQLTEIWPSQELSFERKLNAITRLILILTLLGFLATKSIKIIVTTSITLVVLVIIYKNQKNNKKEGFDSIKNTYNKKILKNVMQDKFQTPTVQNPLMNVMPTDYTENPNRKKAAPITNKMIEQEVNNAVKKSLDPKLFRNLGDNLTFQHSMRTFNAQPATTIPNDQKAFMDYCYGNMKSCKEGDELQCTKNNTDNLKYR
jgi:hypothetical protein